MYVDAARRKAPPVLFCCLQLHYMITATTYTTLHHAASTKKSGLGKATSCSGQGNQEEFLVAQGAVSWFNSMNRIGKGHAIAGQGSQGRDTDRASAGRGESVSAGHGKGTVVLALRTPNGQRQRQRQARGSQLFVVKPQCRPVLAPILDPDGTWMTAIDHTHPFYTYTKAQHGTDDCM